MKKAIACICLISLILNLFGCIKNYQILSDDEVFKRANAFAEVVISAMASRDEAAFADLFTDEAKNAPDFEKGMEYLFSIFKGKVLSAEHDATAIGGEISYAGKTCEPTVTYYITTDEDEYCIYFAYYLYGRGYTDKIIRLRLVRVAEMPESGCFNNGGGMGGAKGIYYPGIEAR